MRKHLSTAFLFVALASGCYYAGNDFGPNPDHDTRPATTEGIERSATQSAKAYPAALADVCDDTAKRIEAGEFKSQRQVMKHFQKESADARVEAMKTWEQAFDEEIPPHSDLTVTETAAAYRKAARGFRRAAK